MRITSNLCALALKQLVGGACRAVGVPAGDGAVQGVVGFLMRHFLDHSQQLTEALERSNERAWKALEVALAGDSLWDRCKLVLSSGEDRAFRELVRPFLDSCALAEMHGRDAYRKLCLTELQAARKAGLLTDGKLDPASLAREAGAFARFTDPSALLDAETRALGQMSDELREAGHVNLAAFVALRPRQGDPLLVSAARYFFRRAVETDQALFQGLTFARLEQIQEAQDAGFDSLSRALSEQGDRLERILGAVQTAVLITRDAVLDVRDEQRRQGEQARDIYQAVLALQNRLDLVHREVRPRDSLSLRNDQERALVKQLVAKYRDLPQNQRQEMPALLNAIGKLEVAAGDFRSAQQDFAGVVALTADPKAQAEAHANTYRAALERRDWEAALAELREAVRLDPARFAPFPMDKYRPQRILGAGGFGTAFLCEHRFLKAPVVVKTLADDDLDRDIDMVFGEAQVLRQLDHSAIIRLQDCGFGSPDGASRPYLVMDYFDGTTLEECVQKQPLSVEDLVAIARQVASGLHAAHGKGILHRDVKPANLLVAPRGKSWEAKLIDFGLALRRTGRETISFSPVQQTGSGLATSTTLAGASIAGTLDYAAPEQIGKLQGVSVGPSADVFGFARTCCYALFGTPQPLMRHWRSLPAELAELLESCLEEKPDQRPQEFGQVLFVLDRIGAPPSVSAPQTSVASVAVAPPAGNDARRQELTVLSQQVAGCTRCPGLARSRTRTVFGTGPLEPDIFFIGEAPGADEDRTGQPFVGAAGQVLTRLLAELGIDRSTVYITNLLKCLHAFTRILTEDGWQQIQHVVATKYQGRVAAVDSEGRRVWGRISEYYRSPLGGRRLVKLVLRSARKGTRPAGGVFTEDHEVLTQNGFKQIRSLNPVEDRVHSGTYQPTQGIRQAVIGMLLGDSGFRRGDNTFTCTHGWRQSDYLHHKAKILGLSDSKVHPYTILNKKTGKSYQAVRFTCRATPYFRQLGPMFYPGGIKAITPECLRDFGQISLAYLFMDDGHLKSPPGRTPLAEIATCSFPQEQLNLLLAKIGELGIHGYLRPRQRQQRIHFDAKNTVALSRLIAPYVLESLNYKLLPEHRGLSKTILEYDIEPFFDEFNVLPPSQTYTRSSNTVYCLGVQQYENFVTTSGVVHNCRPPGNRKPEPIEMQNCREHLLRELDVVRPRSIVCLGAPASQGLLGTTEYIGRLRGRLHDFRGVPVVCTYHPAFLLPGRSPEKKSDVIGDIRLVLRRLGRA